MHPMKSNAEGKKKNAVVFVAVVCSCVCADSGYEKCFLLCYLSQFGVVKNILFTFRSVIFVRVICRNDW